MFIKKVFNKIFDEETHSDLLKFGKGVFENKYLVSVKNQKGVYNIKTGPEFANSLVRAGLELASDKLKISGAVISTIQMDVPFSSGMSNAMGVKKYKVDSEVSPLDVILAMDKYPRAFFALSFAISGYELKIKPKAPKSARPSTKTEKDPKPGFCTLKTTNQKIVEDLIMGSLDFKDASIYHTLNIEQIVYPRDFEKMKPEEIREHSKRKGILTRKLVIDGKEKIETAEFNS